MYAVKELALFTLLLLQQKKNIYKELLKKL